MPRLIDYHAVMIDETGCEFGVSVRAASRSEALEKLREDYPESRCDQLESPADRRAREQDLYDHISSGGDWDDDGRPIPGPDSYEDEEEEDWDFGDGDDEPEGDDSLIDPEDYRE